MRYLEFIGADGESMGSAWLDAAGVAAFSPALQFLAAQPVMGAGDRVFTPRDGAGYLRALARQYSGSYLAVRCRDGAPPSVD